MLVGALYIAPALPHFLAVYPEISIDLLFSNFPIDLVAQNVDVDIRIGSLADSSLIARKLTTSERVVVASKAYLAGRPPIGSRRISSAIIAWHIAPTSVSRFGASLTPAGT